MRKAIITVEELAKGRTLPAKQAFRVCAPESGVPNTELVVSVPGRQAERKLASAIVPVKALNADPAGVKEELNKHGLVLRPDQFAGAQFLRVESGVQETYHDRHRSMA